MVYRWSDWNDSISSNRSLRHVQVPVQPKAQVGPDSYFLIFGNVSNVAELAKAPVSTRKPKAEKDESYQRGPSVEQAQRWANIETILASEGWDHMSSSADVPFPYLDKLNDVDVFLSKYAGFDRALVVSAEVQRAVAGEIFKLNMLGFPVVYTYERNRVYSSGGLVRYAQAQRDFKGSNSGDLLVIVVDETSSFAPSLPSTKPEFDGVDIFVSGAKPADFYVGLVRAYGGGTISQSKFKGAVFNPERFEYSRGGLLHPVHK